MKGEGSAFLLELPPQKPKVKGDTKPETTFPCGIADAETPPKHWKKDSRVRAGEIVKLRVLTKHPENPYDLIDLISGTLIVLGNTCDEG